MPTGTPLLPHPPFTHLSLCPLYAPLFLTRLVGLVVHQVRALRVARAGQGGIAEFLHKACTPPSDTALHNALQLLLHIGTHPTTAHAGKLLFKIQKKPNQRNEARMSGAVRVLC